LHLLCNDSSGTTRHSFKINFNVSNLRGLFAREADHVTLLREA
jgi:hypothetical protein